MMKRRLYAFFFFSLVVLPVFGDGGKLVLKSIPEDDNAAVWLKDNLGVGSEKSVEIRLEDGTVFEGYSFSVFSNLSHPIPCALTSSEPIRFFVDSNADGALQAQEGYSGEPNTDSPYANKGFLFRNVAFPMLLGDATDDTLPHTIHADITARIDPNLTVFEVKRLLERFEGTVRLGDVDYPALIVFRTISSSYNYPITTLIIDLNRDQNYLPLDDLWFSTEGVALINQSLWNISTVFHGEEADVAITPYTGALGSLQLAGDGVLKMVVRSFNNQGDKSYDFTLPGQGQTAFTLPAGKYEVKKFWLTPGVGSEIVYQWPTSSYFDMFPFVVQEGQTQTLDVGGPLRQSVDTSVNYLLGCVTLNFSGLTNNRGNHLSVVKILDLVMDSPPRPPAPAWEIHDERGQLVQSGQFEYG